MEALGLVAEGRPICRVLRPRIVSAARHEQERAMAADVVAALRTTLEGIERGAVPLAGLAGLEEWIGRVRALDPRPAARLPAWLRVDASLARTRLHVVELNADMPIGEGHNDAVVDLLEGLPTTARVLAETGGRLLRLLPAMEARIEAALAAHGGPERAAVAWVCWHETPDRLEKVAAMIAHGERRGWRVVRADPRELEVTGGTTRVGDQRVGVVFRLCSTPECLERPDDAAGLVRAEREGGAAVLNPLGTEPLGHKSLLAAVSDPDIARGLPARERRAVERHVPWTRVLAEGRASTPSGLAPDLVAWVLAHRERLVIKPAHGFGGRGVVLGWRTVAAEWEAAVTEGIGRDVVQSRVHLQRERYPVIAPGLPLEEFFEDTDPFVFGAETGGMLTRLSGSEVTNVGAGGGVTATLVAGAA
jgi:hypothetical protein